MAKGPREWSPRESKYTIICLHQNTGEVVFLGSRAASIDEALGDALERYERKGKNFGDLLLLALISGSHENLLEEIGLEEGIPAYKILHPEE